MTLLSAVIWKSEHMSIKLSDPAKVMSKLSMDGSRVPSCCLCEKRYKTRERLLNKKDQDLLVLKILSLPR